MAEPADLSVIQDAPSQDLITRLESLLAEAKSGELQSIAYVVSWRGNTVGSGWSTIKNRMRVMGELYQLLHNLARLEHEWLRHHGYLINFKLHSRVD